MFFTTSNSVRLSFQTYGNPCNRAMLLIHRLGADGQMWGPQIKLFPDQGYYLIVPDVRGHGQSSEVETFSIEDCARDMVELIDHLGIETVTVVGVSMGGVIAQQLACDYPDALDKLILCDTFSAVRSIKTKIGGWFVKGNRQIAENIPQSRFVVLENSMDPSNLVAAECFNREVLVFLQNKDVE
ncbi:MAG: alpha/beta fold hydrolase [candidate division KSB1 bacterium]|nr:alpha/beta fold hydrolase [candidate division KSB1 bacterium]